jgi:hypothetical protein
MHALERRLHALVRAHMSAAAVCMSYLRFPGRTCKQSAPDTTAIYAMSRFSHLTLLCSVASRTETTAFLADTACVLPEPPRQPRLLGFLLHSTTKLARRRVSTSHATSPRRCGLLRSTCISTFHQCDNFPVEWNVPRLLASYIIGRTCLPVHLPHNSVVHPHPLLQPVLTLCQATYCPHRSH